jgi:N-acetylmuramoyl-L-alanine amidase
VNVTVIRRVCIDPGHGGKDPGNVNRGIRESATTFSLAGRIGHYIRLYSYDGQEGGSLLKTVFTRANDRFIGIDKRAQLARSQGCALMVSLHTNSAFNPLANGAEVWVPTKGEHQADSVRLAAAIVAALAEAGVRNRGVIPDCKSRYKSLGVLRETVGAMPAVLVEPGFASNGHDRKLLSSPEGKDLMARKIAGAVARYFGFDPAAGAAAFAASPAAKP